MRCAGFRPGTGSRWRPKGSATGPSGWRRMRMGTRSFTAWTGNIPTVTIFRGTWALADEIDSGSTCRRVISVFVIDNSNNRINRTNAGEAYSSSKQSGAALVGGDFSWQTLAHELPTPSAWDTTSATIRTSLSFGPSRNTLSACSAEFLAAHPYFNPDVGVERGGGPAIRLLSPSIYPEGSASVPIRLELSDPDGLRQLRLRVATRRTYALHLLGYELKMCRGLTGEEEALVEIDYDGVIPSGSAYGLSNLSNPQVHPISITALDADGNRSSIGFDLWQVSRQHLGTLDSRHEVLSATFAPSGKTLVSGSAGGVQLWDLQTRTARTTSLSGQGTGDGAVPRRRHPGLRVWRPSATVGPGKRSGQPSSPDIPTRSVPWTSLPTGGCSPPGPRTASGCGTLPRRPLPRPCPQALLRWPTPPTARLSPPGSSDGMSTLGPGDADRSRGLSPRRLRSRRGQRRGLLTGGDPGCFCMGGFHRAAVGRGRGGKRRRARRTRRARPVGGLFHRRDPARFGSGPGCLPVGPGDEGQTRHPAGGGQGSQRGGLLARWSNPGRGDSGRHRTLGHCRMADAPAWETGDGLGGPPAGSRRRGVG